MNTIAKILTAYVLATSIATAANHPVQVSHAPDHGTGKFHSGLGAHETELQHAAAAALPALLWGLGLLTVSKRRSMGRSMARRR